MKASLEEYVGVSLPGVLSHVNLDGHYWTEGYTLVDPDPLKAAPSFLADLTYDIFLCGKSINLLRLCNPQVKHFQT